MDDCHGEHLVRDKATQGLYKLPDVALDLAVAGQDSHIARDTLDVLQCSC